MTARGASGLLIALWIVSSPTAASSAGDEPVPETIVSTTSVGEVVFPHLDHVESYGIDCVECHHETRAATLVMPHPEFFEDFWVDCAICHRGGAVEESARACSQCHPGQPRTVADQTVSAKVAIHRDCWRCHEPGRGVEASVGCALCHDRSRLGMTAERSRP